MPDITGLRQFLEISRELQKRCHERPPGWRWRTVEDLLLTHGRAWTPASLPAGIKPMLPKNCFANAMKLASRRRDLTYVEGYGWNLIPTTHAWCVDRAGFVIDPTWATLQTHDPAQYWGIPFRLEWVKAVIARSKFLGVLYSHDTGWPALTEDPAGFIDPRWLASGKGAAPWTIS